MTAKTFSLITLLALCGCPYYEANDDGGGTCPTGDMKGTVADMAVAPPKCAAAAGLAGDNLLCVDFSKVTQLTDPALSGWNFMTSMTGNCTGWQITNSKLQVSGFSTLVGTCGITMPATDLKLPANQKYQSATLSIVQTVELNEMQQQAQVYMGLDLTGRQEAYMTGKNSRQQTVVTIARGDLPPAVSSVFQPVLKLTSTVGAGGTVQGWQIESIAVTLNP